MTMGFYVPTNKDVKFPKAYEQCHFYDGLLCCVMDTYIHDPENKHGECPLIEVPPHGRLIDADALRYWSDDSAMIAFDYVTRSQINAAPTIIPASKEGDT